MDIELSARLAGTHVLVEHKQMYARDESGLAVWSHFPMPPLSAQSHSGVLNAISVLDYLKLAAGDILAIDNFTAAADINSFFNGL